MDPSYNNSFGSFSSGGASGVISASGSAPVTVGEKKSKKWAVILIVLLLLVGVGVGVFAFIRNTSRQYSNELTSTFNYYVNYLLYGKDDNSDVKDPVELNYVYYFDEKNVDLAFDEDEIKTISDYYGELSEKMDVFLSVVDLSNLEDDIKDSISSYSTTAKSYFKLRSVYFLSGDDMKRYYLENGYIKTNDFIDSYYGTISGDSKIIENMVEFLKDSSRYYLNEFDAYAKIGCTNGVDIEYDCPNNVVIFEHDKTILELENAIKTIMYNSREEVLKGCQEIYDEIIK